MHEAGRRVGFGFITLVLLTLLAFLLVMLVVAHGDTDITSVPDPVSTTTTECLHACVFAGADG